MGFFEREGLDVELISLSGGAPILDGVMSGSIDIGFSNVVSLVLRCSNGAPFVSVFGGTYEDRDHQNHALLVRKDKWNESPRRALEGGKIAVNTFQNIEELMVQKYLQSIGILPTSIQRVEAPFPSMLPLIESGAVDAVSIVEPFITIARHDSQGQAVWLSNQYLATSSRTLVATYVSSRPIVERKKDSLKRFVKAMTDATNYIENNEGRSRLVIAKFVKIPEVLLSEIGLPDFANTIELSSLQSVIEDMAQFGYVPNTNVVKSSELVWLNQ
jgi:NitT/TauT family transport system substrate-binding protein